MKKITILIIILLVAITIAGWLFKIIFIGQNGTNELTDVSIQNGMGLYAIADTLKENNIISNKRIFSSYVKIRGLQYNLKAGTYKLSGNMSIKELTKMLIDGSFSEKTVRLLEGWNLIDISSELKKDGIISNPSDLFNLTGYPTILKNDSYTDLINNYEFFASLPSGYSLEGFLFPDTYKVATNASANDVLQKAFDNFENKFETKIKPKLLASNFTLYEALTLASIVNKEAKTFENKRKVAGVFMNRLALGMALQSDPTVNYVTHKTTDNPSLEDISIDSLYNTYKYPGLPPGPISNPGLDDILAVLDPIDHNYYYFLNTQSGDLIFSKTFQEHKANRIKYNQ